MKIAISGSITYDYIMDYNDKFKNHILPDKIHILNVSFIIDELKKERGGTAYNICYNLRLLEQKSIMLGYVGKDFEFIEEFKDYIDYSYVGISEKKLTPVANIITDMDNNQVIAFYPGAMEEMGKVSPKDVNEKLDYMIVSPGYVPAMMQHIRDAKEIGVKIFFDPGQQLSEFSKEQLLEAIELSNYLLVNEYELEVLSEKSGIDKESLYKKFDKVIVTLGAKGAYAIDRNGQIFIKSVPTENVIDPTGAGDAFRAGLLKGLKNELDWKKSMQLGSVLAHFCIQKYGTQTHTPTYEEILDKYREAYDEDIAIG